MADGLMTCDARPPSPTPTTRPARMATARRRAHAPTLAAPEPPRRRAENPASGCPRTTAENIAAGAELLSVERIPPGDRDYLADNGAEVKQAQADNPGQWQTWWWVCFAGQVVFIPFIFLLTGRWSPRRAGSDEQAHREAVERELDALGT